MSTPNTPQSIADFQRQMAQQLRATQLALFSINQVDTAKFLNASIVQFDNTVHSATKEQIAILPKVGKLMYKSSVALPTFQKVMNGILNSVGLKLGTFHGIKYNDVQCYESVSAKKDRYIHFFIKEATSDDSNPWDLLEAKYSATPS